MSELIIACVRVGERVPFDAVTSLRNRVARHLPRKYTMVCLTDQPERCSDVAFVDISAMDLRGQWGRMALFEPAWRTGSKAVFLDFDLNIVGDLSPLADVPGEFVICQSETSPCRYNSSVMVLGSLMGNFIWHGFERRRELLMVRHVKGGVAACIEDLYSSPAILQRLLPPDFFASHLRLMHLP
jgi:hypothetical protein